jgi:hypothetical protein
MKSRFALALGLLAAVALASQSAEAGGRRHVDKRVGTVAVAAGAASTAAFFAIGDWKWHDWDSTNFTRLGAWTATTVGCAAVSPIVATLVVNRPLTQREAGVLVGSCVVPIVGGWLVNAAYNANPSWEGKPVAHKKKHWKKKKM